MSYKSPRIAAILQSLEGRDFDPHYLGFFECFNQQLFFEAHEVLEVLWLPQRGKTNDLFYKGLIQLAGAFVHIQKRRREPALALLRLAERNLSQYPSNYEALDILEVQKTIQNWREHLQLQSGQAELIEPSAWPHLALSQPGRFSSVPRELSQSGARVPATSAPDLKSGSEQHR